LHGGRVGAGLEQDGREAAGMLARERSMESGLRRFADIADGQVTYDTDHDRRLRRLAADRHPFANRRCVRRQTFREAFRGR
jgi:hypothetical protein